MEKLRLFVAAPVPRPVVARLARATSGLEALLPGARWAPEANQHVTLKFLGWVDSERRASIEAAASGVARAHEGAELRLDGLGVFPGPRRARVLWAGIEDPAGLLLGLAAALDGVLEPLGFAPETRPRHPHVTVARFKEPQRVDPSALDVDLGGIRSFRLDRIELWRTHLHPRGARYEVMKVFALA